MTTAPATGSVPYSDRYAAISQRLLRQAQEELDADDIIQASEKAWGAAAHAIKSVAEKWGWYHQGHYRLNAVVDFIAFEWEREDLVNLYLSPTLTHINYYEHRLEADKVQMAIDQTKVFVEGDGQDTGRTHPNVSATAELEPRPIAAVAAVEYPANG